LPSISDLFADRFVGLGADLLRTGEGEVARVRGLLRLLERDLAKQLTRLDVGGLVREEARQRRIRKLLATIQKTIRDSYRDIGTTFLNALLQIAETSNLASAAISDQIFGFKVFSNLVTKAETRAFARSQLIQGGLLKEWWKSHSDNTIRRVTNQIRLGYNTGQTNDEIIQTLRGKATGRNIKVTTAAGRQVVIKQYDGGVLNTSYRETSAIVRTSVMEIANRVAFESFKKNKDVVKGVAVLVTFDARTSDICMSLSGGAWFLDDGRAFPDSDVGGGFPGYPPYHIQCRTMMVPVTYSWDELMENAGSNKRTTLGEVSPKVRASMDGEVPARFTYEDWLHTKPKAFQLEVLGPSKWGLWNDGKITMSQLIDFSGRPLTVAELMTRYN
jgi:hypothetical protein